MSFKTGKNKDSVFILHFLMEIIITLRNISILPAAIYLLLFTNLLHMYF